MKDSRRDQFFTLMLVPEGRRGVYRLLLPAWILRAVPLLLLAAAVALAVAIGSAWYLHQRVAALQALEQINASQAREIMQLEARAQSLEEKIRAIDQLEDQVRSLMGLGRGGGQPAGEASRSGRLRPREQAQSLERVRATLSSVAAAAPDQEERLKQLVQDVKEYVDYLAAVPSHWPVRGPVSSFFGYRRSPLGRGEEFHEGLDIAVDYGTEVQAAGNGTVVFAGRMPVYGQAVIIDHGYGITSMYGHNSRLLVKAGDRVERGQAIARAGSSGRSTGPHVHFQVERDGELQDPLHYLNDKSPGAN